MVAASLLLDAWERGSALPLPDRAPSVLPVFDPLARPDELTVGQCDALLFGIYRQLFGDVLDATTRCRICGDEISLLLPLDQLQPSAARPPDVVDLEIDGYRLACHTVRNQDLRALLPLGASLRPADVLQQCLLEAVGPHGKQLSAAALPDPIVDAALRGLADADPAAHVELALTCPCGATWTDLLDIRTVFWSEFAAWAAAVLHDIAHLARHYGWSEHEILQLSAWRRAWYVQASS